jgi:putative component of toxin-antitoxin plasmid stabilization module
MEPEWPIETAYASPGRFKRFAGRHPREYESLFVNLERIVRLLRGGNKLGGFRVGFFRPEGEGVYRIGQTGVESARESRLYVYLDEEHRVIYTLNIGDKDSQSEDINESKRIAATIKEALKQQKTRQEPEEGAGL